MLTSLRALLSLVLLAALYAVAGIAAILEVVVLALMAAISSGSVDMSFRTVGTATIFASTTVPAVVALVRGVFAVSGWTGVARESVHVSRADAPALWDVVAGLAAELGTAPPRELRLTAEVNAEVTEETRLLGLRCGTRRLYIGVPLLLGLSSGELRAVLCHELGHYARRHTRAGALAYRAGVALDNVLEQLKLTWVHQPGARGSAVIFYRVFHGYARLYFRLSSAVVRRQEIEADRAAAAVAGREATIEALKTAHALPAAWQDFTQRYLGAAMRVSYIPEDLFGAFAAMLADPRHRDLLARSRRAPEAPRRSRSDSHPSLSARLEILSGSAEDTVIADPAPASRLLAQPKRLFQSVQDGMIGHGPDTPTAIAWQQWADLTAEVLATDPARRLVEAARSVAGTPTPSLGTVLDLLERARGERLASDLAKLAAARAEPAVEDAWLHLRDAVFALVGQTLVAGGLASWELSWVGPSRLVPRDVTRASAVLAIPDLVDAAIGRGIARPHEVERLRLHLLLLGLDIHLPVVLVPTTAPGAGGTPAPPGSVRIEPGAAEEMPEEQRSAKAVTLVVVLGIALAGLLFGVDAAIHPPASSAIAAGGGLPRPQRYPTTTRYPLPSLGQSSGWQPPATWPLPDLTALPPSVTIPLEPMVVVQRGDTLTSIARCYGTTVEALQRRNDLGSSTRINAGDILVVPAPEKSCGDGARRSRTPAPAGPP